MTYEDFLLSRGYGIRGEPGGGEDAPRYGWARNIGGGDEAYVQFLEGDNEQDMLRDYQYSLQPPPPPAPTPPPPAPRQPWEPDPNQTYVLGGAIPVYRPPPTPENPTPEPQVDWDAWKQITANYEAAKGSDTFNPAGLALAALSIIAAPATGGLSLAIGESILGVGAVGAATVGAAVLGSASSSVLAALTGGDVVKSAITGAITAGAGANVADIGTAIAGGADNVKTIADALDLTTKQVTTAISNAVTSGVVSAAVTGTDVTTAITSTLAGSVVGSYTTNLVANIPDLKDSASLIGNVAKVATKATTSGTNVGDALVNNIPSIIGGYVNDPANKTEEIKNDIKTEIAEQSPSTLQVGDTVDTGFGEEVTLADGTKGKITNTGEVIAADKPSDIISVVNKEPSGSVTMMMRDPTSTTGFRDTNGNTVDKEGNLVNEDGSPYLDPNAVDVAPDNVNITTPTTEQELINIIKKDTADKTGTTTTTPNIVTTDSITGEKTTTSPTGVVDTTGRVIDTGGATTTDLTAEPLTVTGTVDENIEPVVVAEEPKPYTPFEEDFPLQTDEEKFTVTPTVIPKKPSQPSRTGKNATLSTGLGIDTNVGSLLGTGLSTRPDISSTSEPYLLESDNKKRRDVWNTESLRGALGI